MAGKLIRTRINFKELVLSESNLNTVPMYSIGAAAGILGISVHTIRKYEKEGLIVSFREKNKNRLYSDADIDRIKCIRESIDLRKISINGMKAIYSLIPCWQIKKCPAGQRDNCAAFLSHNKPCWAHKIENNVCSTISCWDCTVYRSNADCEKIKQSIFELIK